MSDRFKWGCQPFGILLDYEIYWSCLENADWPFKTENNEISVSFVM